MTTMKTLLTRGLVALILSLQVSSCGTLMFQERRGQDDGKIDPNVVLMDGIGLLFFIVPGLVAFVVDFTTGAIYLPPGVEKGEGPFFD